MPKLTSKEIETSWKKFKKNSGYSKDIEIKEGRLALFKVFHRGLGWSLNYLKSNKTDIYDELSDEMIDKIKEFVIKLVN